MYYSRPEELMIAFKDKFEANKGLLGIKYVATQDENLLPEFPVIQIASGAVIRQDHGTQRFLLTFEMSFWVFHANFENTYAERTIEDMELATRIVRFLHQAENRNLYSLEDAEPKIIGGSGRVVQELPGVTVRDVGNNIVTTQLIWNGQSQVNYADS